jgi:hypothetical protein
MAQRAKGGDSDPARSSLSLSLFESCASTRLEGGVSEATRVRGVQGRQRGAPEEGVRRVMRRGFST